jgi:alpha-beta hydrolase superfamily lysophospholipase
MVPLLVVFGVVILFLGGRLYVGQWSQVFRPSSKDLGSPASIGLAYEDHYLKGKKNIKIHCWWIPAPGFARAVIYFHGAEGNITYHLKTIKYLHSLETCVLIIDYPGYGKSEGRPNEKRCYDAAGAAWDFVCREKGIPGKEIILYGHSIGAAVATYLAARYQCRGLVFHSGFTSIPDLAVHFHPILTVRLFCHTKLNNLKRISRCKCPVLVLHSKIDEHIPSQHASRIYSRASAPKKFVQLKERHFSDGWLLNVQAKKCLLELINGEAEQWVS